MKALVTKIGSYQTKTIEISIQNPVSNNFRIFWAQTLLWTSRIIKYCLFNGTTQNNTVFHKFDFSRLFTLPTSFKSLQNNIQSRITSWILQRPRSEWARRYAVKPVSIFLLLTEDFSKWSLLMVKLLDTKQIIIFDVEEVRRKFERSHCSCKI